GTSYPPPPRAVFRVPRVVNGALYICVDASGAGAFTCAFTACDGSLRWHTPTDARVTSDQAAPLVTDRIVYSSTYALNERDGTVRWRIDIDGRAEGALALHALVDDTLFATSQRGIYAINAQAGQIRWLYTSEEHRLLSGPPIIAGRLLYAGTRDS